jgi:UDP-N-acetylglucosamine transferase subunit ALG13
MIFLTVGTVMPFDRLVQAVDEAVAAGIIKTSVFAQIGETSLRPRNMEYAAVLDKHDFDRKVAEAEYLISHAGMGSITTALERDKRLLVMPRRKRFREHVNDHQVATARKFGALGHVLVAYDAGEIPRRLQEIVSFAPAPRVSQADRVAGRIMQFLEQIGFRPGSSGANGAPENPPATAVGTTQSNPVGRSDSVKPGL